MNYIIQDYYVIKMVTYYETVLLTDWFIFNITDNISVKDLCKLKYVCKYYYNSISTKHINDKIITIIHHRLKYNLGTYYDMVINYVKKYDIMISGSFIIQCILNKHYPGSDIDLYSFTYKSMKKEDFFDIVDEDLLSDYDLEIIEKYGDLPNISYIVNELINGTKLQTIYLDDVNDVNQFKQYIEEDFDLDICKNFYSIKNKELYIKNFNNIINKRQIIPKELTLKPKGKFHRIEKYQYRGFNTTFEIGNVLNKVNYFTIGFKLFPFLIFKYDKNIFEKYTFLDYISNGYLEKIILEPQSKNYVEIDLRPINEFIKNGIHKVNKCCKSCFFSMYHNIPHIHITCVTKYTPLWIEISGIEFILIDFDDLDNDRKVAYDTMFNTGLIDNRFMSVKEFCTYYHKRLYKT